jgi:hypothetical protein
MSFWGRQNFLCRLLNLAGIGAGDAAVPAIGLSSGGRTEKERIVRAEVYTWDV